MSLRIICPHCHSPIDPLTMDAAASEHVQYRICPECDELIVLPDPCVDEAHLAEAAP